MGVFETFLVTAAGSFCGVCIADVLIEYLIDKYLSDEEGDNKE